MTGLYELIKEGQESGQSVGVRALHSDETPAVGDIMAASYHWDDGNRSNDQMDGTAVFLVSNPYSADISADNIASALTYFAGPNQRFRGRHWRRSRD